MTEVATKSGASYLGVELDGPLGDGWDPEVEADKLRGATLGVGVRLLFHRISLYEEKSAS